MAAVPTVEQETGLQVDPALEAFVRDELLAGLDDLDPTTFWASFAALNRRFTRRTKELLARRDELQRQVDGWHAAHPGPLDETGRGAYADFLTEIGYLVGEAEPTLTVTDVDAEIATLAGPQLVVPSTVPRYALNAANARWGSLFDALYGTDVLPLDHEPVKGYDEARGAQVIAEADRLLDELFPLADGSHAGVESYTVADGALVPALADPVQFAGFRGDAAAPTAVLLRRNGLHVELTVDREHRVGRGHHAGVADVVLESAVTTIVDLEDSVSTVDGEDKADAYRTWLGLMTGNLVSRFEKGGTTLTRRAEPDREHTAPDGSTVTLPGRATLLVRVVGHHMDTDAVRTADGEPVGEGLLDLFVAVTAALHDLRGLGPHRNSRTGSVYVVKPKQHGPDEVALTVDMLAAVEEALGLPERTVKIGVMDEEKRTSVNLSACVAAAADRIIFVNTGFLDRTGDEIHTCFAGGAVVPKGDMRSQTWFGAYEDRNVDVALRAGFGGTAQIGKGMWAKPAAMREMVDAKIEHPRAGADCAWVPSPTAATLHALHYLRVDVDNRQAELASRPLTDRSLLLAPALLGAERPAAETVTHELETNAQSILGYVVRWVGLGVGCSTVPDLEGVGLMEDRATLRISCQLLANWLAHGIVDEATVRETFARLAAFVDEQNAGEPGYRPMSDDLDGSAPFRAALDLVFTGREEPNGYTEPVLTRWRRTAKEAAAQGR
ncbi:malate synthase G [Pseudonocardia sulfidoxydans NBRC 16205]|uniref:Malate synthase G n=1 Tax=Pseudonocardia sulfidoxydans NBRC 16205 TaxID=1223511 RepID=A0A511DUM3_9PSEU|nr:malate synthase G [Pseudonocardia sulfidoxydans]GEL26798.1 malate synthase G [Pseudonocardia sulfidoxydans NBRC 16205]